MYALVLALLKAWANRVFFEMQRDRSAEIKKARVSEWCIFLGMENGKSIKRESPGIADVLLDRMKIHWVCSTTGSQAAPTIWNTSHCSSLLNLPCTHHLLEVSCCQSHEFLASHKRIMALIHYAINL